ncbi:VanW family protein [Bacillus marasmi]|uniref:VanW family protein n=1 Tax=Bacillus marasmi TaxID=1926279 RepID=UPI0011C794B9|nr:VanW family protein [Bacillus marasmi]
MRKKQEVKLFIVLFICTAFIFSFSHFGASAYEAITTDGAKFGAGTMIGPVDVSEKTKDEAIALLSEKMQNWRSQTNISLQYKENSVPVDNAQFLFDLENSVEMAQDGQQNEVTVTFKSGDMYQYLQSLSNELDNSKVKTDPMLNELVSIGANFKSGEQVVKVEKYLSTAVNDHEIISEASITPEYLPIELGVLVEELSPIKVEAGKQVSLLSLMEQRQFTTFPSEAASMIASVMYQAILSSNFNTIEKHTGQVLPDYLELGFEAKVDYQNHLDFIFANPNEINYEIELQLDGNTLMAKLTGSTFLNQYKVKLVDRKEFEPKTIIQFHPNMNTSMMVKQNGKNGLLIKVYRSVYGESNQWLRDDFISEDFYPPIHRIEVHKLTAPPPPASDGTGDPNANPGTTPGTTPGTQTPGTTPSGDGNNNGVTPTQPTPGQTGDDEDLFGKPNEQTK